VLQKAMLLVFAAFCTAVLVIIGSIYWSSDDAFRGGTFGKEEWSAAERCRTNIDEGCTDQQQRCPRGAMVQDLRQQFLHNGETSKSEVMELIGEHNTHVTIRGEQCEAHYLGMCSGMSFDGDSLYVCYDQHDTLVRSGHIKH
jgi:hypothetical protein